MAHSAFGGKLRLFLKRFDIKNVTLAKALSVDATLVSMWLSGKRRMSHDNPILLQVAEYLIDHCPTQQDKVWLYESVGYVPGEKGARPLVRQVMDWLIAPAENPPAGGGASDFIGLLGDDAQPHAPQMGVPGLERALAALAQKAGNGDDPVRVYISSEQCGVLLHPEASSFWQRLGALRPGISVKVFWELREDGDRVGRLVDRLMPHLLEGTLELHSLRSGEQYFCHNLTVLCGGGAVLVVEPVGGFGNCITIFVEDAGFLDPLGEVFGRLEKLTSPMLTLSEGGRRLNDYYRQTHIPGHSLDVMAGGISPFLLTPPQFERFLSAQGLSPDQQKYRSGQFAQMRGAWRETLKLKGRREVLSLDVLDGLLAGNPTALFGLPLLPEPLIIPDKELARDLLGGLLGVLEEFPDYQLRLTREPVGPMAGQACMIQEDRRAWAQSWQRKASRSLFTENWLLVGGIRRSFREVWDSPAIAVWGRGNLLEAIAARRETLGPGWAGELIG